MNKYLASGDVQVFPSSYRIQNPLGKLTSEQNFSNILNSVTDINSFTISYDASVLKVVIHGYYFELTLPHVPTNLWAAIKVQKEGARLVNFDTGAPAELDSGLNFNGIALFEVAPSFPTEQEYEIYSLKIFENGKLINKVKLNTDSIKYNSTDLTKTLESKQNNLKLSGTSGLSMGGQLKNELTIAAPEKNKLDSLNSKGSNNKHVYFDGSGIAKESTLNSGLYETNYKSNGQIKEQTVYVLNGSITPSFTIYASSKEPSGGNSGDIWFKFTE